MTSEEAETFLREGAQGPRRRVLTPGPRHSVLRRPCWRPRDNPAVWQGTRGDRWMGGLRAEGKRGLGGRCFCRERLWGPSRAREPMFCVAAGTGDKADGRKGQRPICRCRKRKNCQNCPAVASNHTDHVPSRRAGPGPGRLLRGWDSSCPRRLLRGSCCHHHYYCDYCWGNRVTGPHLRPRGQGERGPSPGDFLRTCPCTARCSPRPSGSGS